MRFLFVMDSLSVIDPAGDTTYAFMVEACTRGHECWSCEVGHLSLEHDRAFARAQPTRASEVSAGQPFSVNPPSFEPLAGFDVVFMRKDPPVDDAYLQATWILEAARGQTLLVNDPRGLRELNEHLAILRFPDLIPPTVVTRSHERLRAFLAEQNGVMVVKPVDGYGGRGIFVVRAGDPNTSSILETATAHGTRWTMAQRYLPEASVGDKRIMLVEGELLGAVLRVPGAGEARGNLHVGGRPHQTEVTAREKEIIARLKPLMLEYGILFSGVDVIGDCLTEINITSPTGIRHLDGLQGGRAAGRVIDRVEARAKRSG